MEKIHKEFLVYKVTIKDVFYDHCEECYSGKVYASDESDLITFTADVCRPTDLLGKYIDVTIEY